MIWSALLAAALAQAPAASAGTAAETPVSSLVPARAYYTPAEAEELFLSSTDAYGREEYRKAKEGFEKLVEHGHGSADVLYNLGTTCLALGDLGGAVLALERARRAGGWVEDVEANLALARARQLDRVVGGQTEEPFAERVALATSERVASGALLALWSVAFVALVALRFLPGRRRGVTIAACVLAFLGVLPAGGVVAAHVHVRRSLAEGVVMASSLAVRELPREGGKVAFEVHAGLKVRLLEESGKFVRIRLPNGLEGWTERSGVTPL